MFTIGQLVYFGRERGEKTLGKVLDINRKTVTVEQCEARGTKPIGTKWRVDPNFLSLAPADTAPVRRPAYMILNEILDLKQKISLLEKELAG